MKMFINEFRENGFFLEVMGGYWFGGKSCVDDFIWRWVDMFNFVIMDEYVVGKCWGLGEIGVGVGVYFGEKNVVIGEEGCLSGYYGD